MKTEMTWAGIGPRLALINLPYIILSLAVMVKFPGFFNLDFLDHTWIKAFALIWLTAGILFWIASAYWFLRHFKPGNLIINGPYALCRNPIYSAIIVFIIPGLGIIMHSGLILSVAFVLYITLRISIHGEEVVLTRHFGDEYEMYRRSVNNMFPFPRYLFRKTFELQNQ